MDMFLLLKINTESIISKYVMYIKKYFVAMTSLPVCGASYLTTLE